MTQTSATTLAKSLARSSELKTRRLAVPLTSTEERRLLAGAEAAGLRLATWARTILLDEAGRAVRRAEKESRRG